MGTPRFHLATALGAFAVPLLVLAIPAGASPTRAPHVARQPASVAAALGQHVSFSARSTALARVQWYEAPAGSRSFHALRAATSPTYRVVVTTALFGARFAAVFSNRTGSVATRPAVLNGVMRTSNWAGYIAVGSTYTAVSATWVVPLAQCAGPTNTHQAEWIGIDGLSSPTIEQVGTETNCLAGQANYTSWYEMLGNASVASGDQVATPNQVAGGDTVHASVAVSSGVWTLTLTDVTQGWVDPVVIAAPASAQSSAELIVERPLFAATGTMDPLTNFATTTFSGVSLATTTASGSLSSFPRPNATLVDGLVSATASPLVARGTSFAVTYQTAP